MTSIAFVTTCKGRLHHIQQTLPLIVSQAPDEVIVVDYGCPQRVGDWVESHYPQVKVVRVEDDPGFCLPRARNIGAKHATSPWICFIDADVRIAPGWLQWLRTHVHPNFYFRAEPKNGIRDKETWGTVVCTRQAFEMIGGYDEVFRGWGGDDHDLYVRLRLSGMVEGAFPSLFVDAIPHDDTERIAFHDVKNRRIQAIINELYSEAKLQIARIRGSNSRFPWDARLALMDQIKRAVVDWGGDKSKPMPRISLSVKGSGWLPEPYRMLKECTFTLTLGETTGAKGNAPAE